MEQRASSKSSPRSQEGHWICENAGCSNVNLSWRMKCYRCGMKRVELEIGRKKPAVVGAEIGKTAAAKSRGLFSAEDWQCSKCGNVNWARRSQCNVCNAPRFDIEQRTGHGGGYNDRGVVEYKERDDSDDEYDEFGRKKKQYRKPSIPGDTDSSKNEERSASKEKSDSGSEEEDDEDDGDLSKYDLSGWGDQTDDKTVESKVTPLTEISKTDDEARPFRSARQTRNFSNSDSSSSSARRSRTRSRSPISRK